VMLELSITLRNKRRSARSNRIALPSRCDDHAAIQGA
jgi:hypothetical protein